MNIHTLRNTFNLRDTILLAIITCAFIVLIISLLLLLIPSFEYTGAILLTSAQTIAQWTGLVLLIVNGTTYRTKYWPFIVASLSVIVLGMMFKIMHWPGADQTFLLGFILLESTYTIRFITKSSKGLLDWAKYSWITSWCLLDIYDLLDEAPYGYDIISPVLFWITISLFVWMKIARGSHN